MELLLLMLEQWMGRGPRTDTMTLVWPNSTRAEPVDSERMDLARWSCRRVLGPLVEEVVVVFCECDGWREDVSCSLFGRAYGS